MGLDQGIADVAGRGRILVFCTCYAESISKWEGRYRRWLDAVEASGVRYDQILIVDDGSPILPGWADMQIVSRLADADPSSKKVLHHFETRLGRKALFDFPGWYRSFCFAAIYARHFGFTKVIHIESDTFVTSGELTAYINATEEGWIAFWCKRWSVPETCLQIIAGTALQAFFVQADVPHETLVGRHYEEQLPFTHVEKAFEGDRYGEYLAGVPRTAHYVAQVPDEADTSYFWWLGADGLSRSEVADLRKAAQSESDPALRASRLFELARALDVQGESGAALDAYLDRAGQRFDAGETYVCLLRAGQIMEQHGRSFEEVIDIYERASSVDPMRAEGLHSAAKLCFANSANRQACDFAKRGIDLAPPARGLLVEPWIYHYGLLDQYAINAYWAGLHRESLDASLRALAGGQVPSNDQPRFIQNARFALEKLNADAGTAPFPYRVNRSGSLVMYRHEDDLTRLATKHRTDKWNTHWYARHYHRHFERFRPFVFNLLEIGVGGYEDPFSGGESLRMWEEYFPFAKVYGLDCFDKSAHNKARVKTVIGDQSDPVFLQRLSANAGGFDIIIDDGSHVNAHVLASFDALFPLLRSGGIYAVEDTQTSYWPRMGGDSHDLNKPTTTMGYFKSLVDGLNHVEFIRPDYQPTYTDLNISAISFYHNLVIIDKDDNWESSNLVQNNRPTSFTGGE